MISLLFDCVVIWIDIRSKEMKCFVFPIILICISELYTHSILLAFWMMILSKKQLNSGGSILKDWIWMLRVYLCVWSECFGSKYLHFNNTYWIQTSCILLIHRLDLNAVFYLWVFDLIGLDLNAWFYEWILDQNVAIY